MVVSRHEQQIKRLIRDTFAVFEIITMDETASAALDLMRTAYNKYGPEGLWIIADKLEKRCRLRLHLWEFRVCSGYTVDLQAEHATIAGCKIANCIGASSE